jgi:Tfp pilus assembly protein PilF
MTKRWAALLGLVLVLFVGLTACGGGKKTKSVNPEPKELSLAEKVRMADSFRNAGRMNEALELLEETAETNSDNGQLHRVYGEYLFLAGRYQEAEGSLNRALEIDPYLTDARNWLGAALTEQERFDEARQQYRKALEDPSYPSPQLIYLNLGVLYRKQGMDQKGIDEFRRAVQIDPRFYKAHFELALALESIGSLDEALDEIIVAEPSFRTDGEYWYRRGFLEFRAASSQEAMESLRRCIDVSPGSPASAKARELMEVIEG